VNDISFGQRLRAALRAESGRRINADRACRDFQRRRQASRRGRRLVVAAVAAAAVAAVLVPAVLVRRAGPEAGGGRASSPALTVVPGTGLAGGQQLRIRLAGFPKRATVMVYECTGMPTAGGRPGCGAAASSYLYTGATGSASGLFTAQPAAGTGPNGTSTACRTQCVLVGRVIKVGAGLPANPVPMATAPLSFSATAMPGLANSWLVDLSWISATDGWALAAQPCVSGTCARLAHTTDSGLHWEALPNPPAQLQDGTVDCSKVACVSGVQFASPTVGYLYGPALLITSDGGRTWHAQPGLQVETLTIAGNQVYRVGYDHLGCPGPCQPTLQRATIGSSAWQPLISQLASSDGDAAQIVSSGSTLLLAMFANPAQGVFDPAVVYRSADGGATWQQGTDPCSSRPTDDKSEQDYLTDLAGAPAGFLAGLCSPPSGSGTFIVTSSDGGQSWQTAGTLPGVQALALLAAASPTTLAVSTAATGGNGAFTAQLLVTTDAGRHWITAATETQQILQAGVPAWLGFATSQAGAWISGPHSVWITKDGGLHWTRTQFP
jgi:photosystem II stability/assembly factor-like uncharacterized protein